jgi:hypothetical protein
MARNVASKYNQLKCWGEVTTAITITVVLLFIAAILASKGLYKYFPELLN